MTPKTTKGAIEKMYRVRQYLNGQMAYGGLSYEQMMGFSKAHELCGRAQRANR